MFGENYATHFLFRLNLCAALVLEAARGGPCPECPKTPADGISPKPPLKRNLQKNNVSAETTIALPNQQKRSATAL